jgi:hypothetical protein
MCRSSSRISVRITPARAPGRVGRRGVRQLGAAARVVDAEPGEVAADSCGDGQPVGQGDLIQHEHARILRQPAPDPTGNGCARRPDRDRGRGARPAEDHPVGGNEEGCAEGAAHAIVMLEPSHTCRARAPPRSAGMETESGVRHSMSRRVGARRGDADPLTEGLDGGTPMDADVREVVIERRVEGSTGPRSPAPDPAARGPRRRNPQPKRSLHAVGSTGSGVAGATRVTRCAWVTQGLAQGPLRQRVRSALRRLSWFADRDARRRCSTPRAVAAACTGRPVTMRFRCVGRRQEAGRRPDRPSYDGSASVRRSAAPRRVRSRPESAAGAHASRASVEQVAHPNPDRRERDRCSLLVTAQTCDRGVAAAQPHRPE